MPRGLLWLLVALAALIVLAYLASSQLEGGPS
jgi:hypothetical protein